MCEVLVLVPCGGRYLAGRGCYEVKDADDETKTLEVPADGIIRLRDGGEGFAKGDHVSGPFRANVVVVSCGGMGHGRASRALIHEAFYGPGSLVTAPFSSVTAQRLLRRILAVLPQVGTCSHGPNLARGFFSRLECFRSRIKDSQLYSLTTCEVLWVGAGGRLSPSLYSQYIPTIPLLVFGPLLG